MVRPFDFGRIELVAGLEAQRATPKEDEPFRVALLADFGGAKGESISRLRVVQVDRDNLDGVIAKLQPLIQLPLDEDTLSLRFRELEDFHPDRLLENIEIFRRLRELRRRVKDPATFPVVVEELGLEAVPPRVVRRAASTASTESVVSSAMSTPAGSLLEDIVEQSQGARESGNSRRPDELQEFVRRVTQPHLEEPADPRQAEVLEMIDRALSAQMRALLHVPAFQALEAAWRAVYFLTRRIETGPELKLYLIDISQDELRDDLLSTSDLRQSETYKLLVEKTVGTPGAERFALLVGNYTFGDDPGELSVLGRMAKIARAAGAPFVAAASPRLVGCESVAEMTERRDWGMPLKAEAAAAWKALRQLPEAAWIGLAMPRFLLRLPYGKETDPIDSFAFEEMPGDPEHQDYLWGNPAYACALLLTQSFSDEGWEVRPGTHSEIDGLPLHVYKHDGESELKPCAEMLMPVAVADKLLESGIMVLASLKGSDAVRLVRFQSIAEPVRRLAGRWQG